MKKSKPNLQCLCCGHRWKQRRPNPPQCCSVCKSYSWRTGIGPVTKAALINQKAREAEAKKRIAAIKSGALESNL